MNFHQLQIFNVVAKLSSYSKAANELFLSQPTVSVHLQKLEQELGMDLFEQLGRTIYLTDAGRMLFHYTQKIFSLADEAEHALDELIRLKKGRLRLGADTTLGIYYLPALIRQFKDTYPGIELILEVANTLEMEQKVLNNQLDFALIGHNSSEADLISQPFRKDHLVMILGPNHPLINQTLISLEDLEHEHFIIREQGSSTREAIEKAFEKAGVCFKVAMEYASTDGVKHAVAANLGISFVSDLAVKLCGQTGLVNVREIPQLSVTREFCMIYHKEKHLSPLIITFINLITNYATLEGKLPCVS